MTDVPEPSLDYRHLYQQMCQASDMQEDDIRRLNKRCEVAEPIAKAAIEYVENADDAMYFALRKAVLENA